MNGGRARPRRPRTVTLTSTKSSGKDVTGLLYGKTIGWWFVHVDGETKTLPVTDWVETTEGNRK